MESRIRISRRGILGALLTVVACGGGDPARTPGGPSGPSGPSSPSTSNQIAVADNQFTPSSTTIAAGTTVTWTWQNTGTPHNVTFANGPNAIDMQTGTFQRLFAAVGTFAYSCTRHGGMNGTITVQ